MKTVTTATAYAALALAAFTATAQERESACKPVVIDMRADFPHFAQERRQHGKVHLAIRLDAAGRVADARVVESSGHAALDRAALTSARRHWRFDVARCAAGELIQEQTVTVRYERPPGLTVSGTLDRKSLARTRELMADDRCQSTQVTHNSAVFACRDAVDFDLADARR